MNKSHTALVCFLLALSLSACIYALAEHTNVSENSDRYGYIDKSGLYKIKPQDFNAQNFSEGLAAVVNGTQLSYIKSDGTQAFWRRFEIPISQGRALSKDGCRVVHHDFVSQNCSFSEGLAAVPFISNRSFLWGYINKQGKTVIKPQFMAAGPFHEGLAAVKIGDNDHGFIDHTGKVVIHLAEKSNPRAKSSLPGPMPFTQSPSLCDNFSSALAPVMQDGKWGYVNKAGQFVIKPQYGLARSFSDDVALVREDSFKPEDSSRRTGASAKVMPHGPSYSMTWSWYFIDKTGKKLFDKSYHGAGDFVDGLAPVMIDKKWGFVNKHGEIVIPAQFDSASSFSDNLASVKVGEKYGCIDKKGKVIIQPKFSMPFSYSEDLSAVRE